MKLKLNWLRLLNTASIGVLVFIIFRLSFWKEPNRVIESDVISYYAYVPATFIHGDPSLNFLIEHKKLPGEVYWPLTSPTGKYVMITSMGLAYLYTPFFLIAHAITPFTKYPADGFSQPYKQSLALSSIFFISLGIYFLRKFLQKEFSKDLIAITILSLVFGTNLIVYCTILSTMAHAYNFSLFCAFIFFTNKWYNNKNIKYSITIGLLIGLISLIRPTNVIILLFFLFYEITSPKEVAQRVKLYLINYKLILIMFISTILIWVPQLIYWKFQTGQFFYFSYPNSNFFFNNPNISNGLFSFRNGWLIYTPIMVFALIGIPFLLKTEGKKYFLSLTTFTFLNIYIILSWWCWWYTGYGNRPFIDSYPLLAIPFIFLLKTIKNFNKIAYLLTIHILFCLILFNLFQSRQYYLGSIHYDSMTKESYLESLGNLHPTAIYYNKLKEPNYYNSRIGINENIYEKRVYFCGAEKLDSSKMNFLSELNKGSVFIYSLNRSSEESFKGKYSIKLSQSDPYGFNYLFNNIKYQDKLNITVWMLDKNNSNQGGIVCSSTTPSDFYAYGNNVIKSLPNGWKKIQLKITMPFLENKNIKIYAMNNGIEPIFFDNMLIERDKVLANIDKY